MKSNTSKLSNQIGGRAMTSTPLIYDAVLELPKPDKRYKVRNIKKDKSGKLRGNPKTVELKRLQVPSNAPLSMQLNPPYVMSQELAREFKL